MKRMSAVLIATILIGICGLPIKASGAVVTASVTGGKVAAGTAVTLSCDNPAYTIRYTMSGNNVTEYSSAYTTQYFVWMESEDGTSIIPAVQKIRIDKAGK